MWAHSNSGVGDGSSWVINVPGKARIQWCPANTCKLSCYPLYIQSEEFFISFNTKLENTEVFQLASFDFLQSCLLQHQSNP